MKNSFVLINEIKPALKEIIQLTNWSYNDFKNKTLVYGVDREADLNLIYNDLYQELKLLNTEPEFRNYSLILKPNNAFTYTSLKPDCVQEVKTELFNLCFYKNQADNLILRKNNIGHAYGANQENLVTVTQKIQAQQVNDKEFLFTFNNCENLQPNCTVYFKLQKINDKQLLFTALGDPIAVPDQAINPTWVVSFQDFKINLICENKNYELSPYKTIGYEKDRDTYLAPYGEVFNFDCNKIEKINLSSQYSSYFRMYKRELNQNFSAQWPAL